VEVTPPGFSACYQEDSESVLKFRSHDHTSENPPDKSGETVSFVTATFLDLEVQIVKVTELFRKSNCALFPRFPSD